jgi:hypothetical protein
MTTSLSKSSPSDEELLTWIRSTIPADTIPPMWQWRFVRLFRIMDTRLQELERRLDGVVP